MRRRISKKWSSLRAGGLKLGKRVGMKKACVGVARKLAIESGPQPDIARY
jgi:hypothetical protein